MSADQGASGRFVRLSHEGVAAFVPDPLPPDVVWDLSLISALGAAEASIGRAVGLADRFEGIDQLTHAFIRREAVLSSRIEGTVATTTDLALFEFAGVAPERSDVREVGNYRAALDFVLATAHERPISLALVCDIHAMLLQDVPSGDRTPGRFRAVQNFIAPSGRGITQATYVPPPPLHMHDALAAWEAFATGATELPRLARHALLHYQFEAIHPFADGNGRVGRLLIAYFMKRDGLLPSPIFAMSAFLEANRAEYYARLAAVGTDGAWYAWLSFYLRGIESQAIEAVVRIERLSNLRAKYRTRATKSRASALLPRLIDLLFADPVIDATTAAHVLGVGAGAALALIERLAEAGILTEVTGRRRGRVYVAREIIACAE